MKKIGLMLIALCSSLAIVSAHKTGISASSTDSITISKPDIKSIQKFVDTKVVAPDNDAILASISDSESPYFYPYIFLRYKGGDTTLTIDDYRHLYYGYAWQPTYAPFDPLPNKTKVMALLEQSNDTLRRSGYEAMITAAEQVLEVDPFDPAMLNILTFVYGILGNTEKEHINFDRMQKVLATIKSSGTGIKESSPWAVLNFSHATDVMASMELTHKKPLIISRTVEYLELPQRTDGVKGYYFDYGRVYWFRPEKMPQKSHPGWEFNGIPLKKK